MKTIFYVLFFLSSTFILTKDEEKYFGNYKLKVEGKGGIIHLQYSNISQITIEFLRMIEVTKEGTLIKGLHSLYNFTHLDFEVSDFTNTTYQDLNTSIITTKVNNFIKQGSMIMCQIIIFNQKGLIDTGNNITENVSEGTMKLSMNIVNWPFCNNSGSETDEKECSYSNGEFIKNQYLDVGIELKGKFKAKKLNRNDNITLGDSYASFSSYYIADSKLKQMPEDFPYVQLYRRKNIMNMRFERFENYLTWDPLFVMNESEDPILPDYIIVSGWTVFIFMFTIIVFVLVGSSIYTLYYKKKKSRKQDLFRANIKKYGYIYNLQF